MVSIDNAYRGFTITTLLGAVLLQYLIDNTLLLTDTKNTIYRILSVMALVYMVG